MRISDWSSDVCSSDLDGSQNRPADRLGKDDRKGAGHHAEIEGELHQSGLHAEAVLDIDRQNADAAEACPVPVKGKQTIAEQQAADQGAPERMQILEQAELRLDLGQQDRKSAVEGKRGSGH